MEILYFTLAGIILYLFSDWTVRRIEAMRGGVLPQRSLFFFAIMLVSTLILFNILDHVGGERAPAEPSAPEPAAIDSIPPPPSR